MKIELQKIIEELKEIVEKTNLEEVYDKEILDCAVKIYLSKKTQETKKENIINKPINRIDEPATEKQKQFLVKNDYKGDMNLTKEEARIIIKEFIEQQQPNY
jgi:hypothetical protein